ncbi:methyl-accepting chemotaxis protein [Alicyclobacillus fastidiosus]|uniref:Methyl-accepting chemotaxis protein n=1 Tax=Alicyclobacillus fastidiosus TaxID=392011 RepID=A0ABV5AF08_9BACL|nr:methyl-accepting chemotaxis protein [Alicyclobacillus fastidiosus]WEH09521.1 methyl-accepting chemotaxis protein [Alicyclobacillus fastidiosus]
MPFKIGPKLFTSFAAILIIPTIAVSVFSYESAKSSVNDQMQKAAQSSVNLVNDTINQYIKAKEQDIQVLASEVNAIPTDDMWTYVDKYQAQHPELETTYIGTSNGQFVNAPHNIMPKGYDPRQRPWYQEAVANPGHVIVTAPYVSVSSGQEVVTIAEQTADGQAVMAENLQLKTIQSIVSKIKIGHQGYVVLLDGDKNVIDVPGKKPGSKATGSEITGMYQATSGKLSYTSNGSSKEMVFTTNPVTKWKIAGTYDNNEAVQAANPILTTTLTVLIIALILGALLVIFVVRSILKPLGILVQSAKRISDGDLTQAVVIHNRDEFGELGKNFEEMRQSLQSILHDVSTTSSQVASSAEELMASSDQGAAAAQVIAEAIQEVAAGSEQQADRVGSSTHIVEEMSGGIQQVAVSSESVVTTATGAADVADRGQKSIESVVRQMNHIDVTLATLVKSVTKLAERSTQIGEIVEVITDIASRTNLLSLNASIEAARAGEHGKGFAIVANEIRKLAEQSSRSAQEITELVNTIQADTNEATLATTSTSQAVQEGMNAVAVADQSFSTIQASVGNVANQIHEVSAAVQQMAANSDEVRQSISQIADIAEMTAAGTHSVSAATEEQLASMEEISASATELARVAEQLQDLIRKFNI